MTEKEPRPYTPYSITPEERAKRLANQGGKCLICTGRAATDLDHNHATGEVRALLCHGCNVLLGSIAENPTHLRALARRHPLRAPRYDRAANYLLAFGRERRIAR